MRTTLAAALLGLACRSPSASAPAPASPPAAPPTDAAGPPVAKTEDVADVHHGVTVPDPYRWLERADDPDVVAWSDAQNAWARSILDALPAAAALRPKVEAVLTAPVVDYGSVVRRGDRLFASKRQPPRPQPVVVVLPASGDPSAERVLLDPTALDPAGKTSVDWFVPSPDGTLLAVSLSAGGSESGDLNVYDVATGKPVHETIPRVNGGTAGGDLAWARDGKGFWYTRYPREGERPAEDLAFWQALYFHRLGDPPDEDVRELGEGLPRVAEIQVEADTATDRVIATVQKGDGGEFAHFLRGRDGKWTRLSTFGDRIVHVTFGPKNTLYAVSRADAPRGRLLAVSASRPDLAGAKVVIEQGPDTLVTDFWGGGTVVATPGRIYALYQTGGPSELRAFDLRGRPVPGPEAAPVSAVHEIVRAGGDGVLFDTTSYTSPTTWYRYDAKAKASTKLGISSTLPVDFSNVEVRREMAVSADGTEVPVNILLPRGAALDGSHPCLVTGYGGYAISLSPSPRSTWSILLDAGFVVAVANLRGGSEFGDAWHEAGRLTRKQNVFDDFDAVLRHMIDRGYTRPDRLAIEGGSNGGLLMGATLVQHPERVRAVVAHVGIYDMLRVELSPNGAFNVSEFGTVKNAEHFAALHAYSPYHNVEDGTAYPAVLFMTGANDPRVDPMQSRKMTARLQAATSGEAPILLRTSSDTGHGGGTPLPERIAQTVDAYAFLFAQLGVSS